MQTNPIKSTNFMSFANIAKMEINRGDDDNDNRDEGGGGVGGNLNFNYGAGFPSPFHTVNSNTIPTITNSATPKTTPSKVININKSNQQQQQQQQQQKNKPSPNKSKKSAIPSFSIVEPGSSHITPPPPVFNKNTSPCKTQQIPISSITNTVDQTNTNNQKKQQQQQQQNNNHQQKKIVKVTPIKYKFEIKEDNILDNIHQEEEDKHDKESYSSSDDNDNDDDDDDDDDLKAFSDSETSGVGIGDGSTNDIMNIINNNNGNSNNDFIPISCSTSLTADGVPESIKISKNIKLSDFKILHLIGKGGFGKVHQVMHKLTGKVYALKTIKKNHIIERKSVLNTLAEKDILKRIQHPFIVKLHFAFQTEKKLYLVMDFINGGQLFYHLQKESILSEAQVRFYTAELVLALEHLHDLNIIHRDLKPENILLDSEGHCVLTDFGLAKEEITNSDDGHVGSLCGTFEYMSPEMITGKSYGKAVDWWAIGILMYDMLIGKPPFESKNRAIAQEKIVKEKPKFPTYIGATARSLINALLQKDPKKRLGSNGGATEIKKHPFFKSIQWRKLELKEIPSPFIPKTNDSNDISNFDAELLKTPIRDSFSASPNLSSSQQAYFDGFSFVRTPIFHHISTPTTLTISRNDTMEMEKISIVDDNNNNNNNKQ